MLRQPLTKDDFSSSRWQRQQQQQHDLSLFPETNSLEYLTLEPLNDQPFDLTRSTLLSAEEAATAKRKRILNNEEDVTAQPQPSQQDELLLEKEEEESPVEEEDQDVWVTVGSQSQLPEWIRMASWDDSKTNEHEPHVSPFLTESMDYFHALYQTNFPDTFALDQDRLVKDVIYLLIGVPSHSFEWQQHQFQPRQQGMRLVDVSPSSLHSILQPMLLFGTRMKALDIFCTRLRSMPAQFGAMGTSFGCCLGDLLSYLQHTVTTMYTSSSHSVRLLDIHHGMEGFYILLHHLADLCSSNENKGIPYGSQLLTILYHKLQHVEDLQFGYVGLLKGIYMTLWTHTSTPWLAMMTQWLTHGTVHDTHKEFFIIEKTKPAGKVKTVDKAALPCFLPYNYAKLVLRAGMSIHKHTTDIVDPFQLAWSDTDVMLQREDVKETRQTRLNMLTNIEIIKPPTLTLLPEPDDLFHHGDTILTLNYWMDRQQFQHFPPLSILVLQRLLEPLQQRCHHIFTTLGEDVAESIATEISSKVSSGRRDLFFTYWKDHDDEYPTTFYTDLVTRPFTLSSFLHQQRQQQQQQQSSALSPKRGSH